MFNRMLLIFLFCFTGCIFNNDDVRECEITGQFYLSSINGHTNLLYKRKGKEKLVGTGFVAAEAIDSIYWDSQIVIVHRVNGIYGAIAVDSPYVGMKILKGCCLSPDSLLNVTGNRLKLKPLNEVKCKD